MPKRHTEVPVETPKTCYIPLALGTFHATPGQCLASHQDLYEETHQLIQETLAEIR